MHTGTSSPSARMRLTTETPSRSGIVTSSTTTAGGRSARAVSASRPPAAVDTRARGDGGDAPDAAQPLHVGGGPHHQQRGGTGPADVLEVGQEADGGGR